MVGPLFPPPTFCNSLFWTVLFYPRKLAVVGSCRRRRCRRRHRGRHGTGRRGPFTVTAGGAIVIINLHLHLLR